MLAAWVHDKITPLPFDRAAPAMRYALTSALGSKPSEACLALALAKCALETGRWKSCHCWNWGNIKAGEKYEGMFCTFELNEVLREDGKNVVTWFSPRGRIDGKGGKVVAEAWSDPPGHPQTRMRAHENEFAGADAYLQFMIEGSSGRFKPAFERMKAGDAGGMVHLMKVAGYMTADEGPYASAVASIQREYLGKLAGQSPDQDVSEDDMCRAVACLAPDPERYLHTEAVIAAMNSMDGVWDAIRSERNAAMREPE